jgi:hypothetical protein
MWLLGHYRKNLPSHLLFDKLVAIHHSIVLDPCGELHPIDPPYRLCFFGSSRGTPLCHSPLNGFVKSITLSVSSFLPVLGPSTSSPCVSAPSLKRRHHKWAFSWLPCKLPLTPCAGNSTAGSLLTGWQAILIATLPWIVPVCPGASQDKTCKTESGIPYRVAREPNYNILSE